MTAGYSGTPLPKKLGIKDASRVALVEAPKGFAKTLGVKPIDGQADVIVFFTTERKTLEKRFAEMKKRLHPDGRFWVAWPKKASGVETDVTEDVVRKIALERGLVDNKVCAIDETWSGLQLVYRLKDRPSRRTP